MKKERSERRRREKPQSQVVRRSDSLGRSYYTDRGTGKRVSAEVYRNEVRRLDTLKKKKGPGSSRARVVRRTDSSGRAYHVDVDSGRRVSRDAWEIDVERRRAVRKIPRGEKRKKPRPMGVQGPRETHPLGKPGVPPFPKGVTERGIPRIEEMIEIGDGPVEIEAVEDEADYEEGVGA